MSLTSSDCSLSTVCLHNYVVNTDVALQEVVKLELDQSEEESEQTADALRHDHHNRNDNVSPFLIAIDDGNNDGGGDAVYMSFSEEAEVNDTGGELIFFTDGLPDGLFELRNGRQRPGELSAVTDHSEAEVAADDGESSLLDTCLEGAIDSSSLGDGQNGMRSLVGGKVRVIHMLSCTPDVNKPADIVHTYQLVTDQNGITSLISADDSQLQQLHEDGLVHSNNKADKAKRRYTYSKDNTKVSHPKAARPKAPPDGCPSWAASLQDCERLGDSYRGWVETEEELDRVLLVYKQTTQSYWGTRQSPCRDTATTRLMWRSQYAPFDGIPFINAGSRAVVMECQYGPRRQGTKTPHMKDPNGGRARVFKESCPARIYVKRVIKFPDYAVDIRAEKKYLKAAMDEAFQLLKDRLTQVVRQNRYYIQLPIETAHEFHQLYNDNFQCFSSSATSDTVNLCIKPEIITAPRNGDPVLRRLHPRVACRIRELVSAGETKLYDVRNKIRNYVTKEMFDSPDLVPDKHDLSYFPTVNDLQNHICQALRDIEAGILPLSTANIRLPPKVPSTEMKALTPLVVSSAASASISNPVIIAEKLPEKPVVRTMTVTMRPTSQSVSSAQQSVAQIEMSLSDGTRRIIDTVPPNMKPLLNDTLLTSSSSLTNEATTSDGQTSSVCSLSASSPPSGSLPSSIEQRRCVVLSSEYNESFNHIAAQMISVFDEDHDESTVADIIEADLNLSGCESRLGDLGEGQLDEDVSNEILRKCDRDPVTDSRSLLNEIESVENRNLVNANQECSLTQLNDNSNVSVSEIKSRASNVDRCHSEIHQQTADTHGCEVPHVADSSFNSALRCTFVERDDVFFGCKGATNCAITSSSDAQFAHACEKRPRIELKVCRKPVGRLHFNRR